MAAVASEQRSATTNVVSDGRASATIACRHRLIALASLCAGTRTRKRVSVRGACKSR